MANEITFKFKSDAPWSDSELGDLFETFLDEVKRIDDDFVANSASINLTEEGNEDNKAARDAAIEMIANGKLSVTVQLKDDEGVSLYENEFDADAS